MSKKSANPKVQIRGDRIIVNIDKIVPNSWNPNRQSEQIQQRMDASLRKFGVVSEILVREVTPGKYEVIDGEHRYHQLRKAGVTAVEVRNLGEVSENEAQQLTVIMNELKGRPSAVRMSNLLSELEGVGQLEDAMSVLPMHEEEVKHLLSMQDPSAGAAAIGLGEEPEFPEDEFEGFQPPPGEDKPKAKPKTVRFVFGNYRGDLPLEVAEPLKDLWLEVSERASSSDVGVVFPILAKSVMNRLQS